MEFKLDTEFLQKLALRNTALGNTIGCKQNYNLVKLAEESTELGLVCLQKHMKPTKVQDKEISDEIGDLILRVNMYLADKPEMVKAVQERINYKTGKYKDYKRDALYAQI